MFTNFEYITFFSCPAERNIFYKRFISIKPLWLEIIEKKGCTKSVRVIYIIYIIVLGRTDFVHPLFSIISSQSGIIEMDLLQKNIFLVGHEKNVIYSKMVNNPFKRFDFSRQLNTIVGSKGFKVDNYSNYSNQFYTKGISFVSDRFIII